MNDKPNWVHWATLLYALVLVASLLITGTGKAAPPAGLSPGLAMIAAQVGLILVPALIFVWWTRQPWREALELRRVSIGTAIKSLLLGLACWPIFTFLSTLTQVLVASVNRAAATESGSVATQSVSPWIVLLGIAVVAPFCEEVLFRGVLLSAYERCFASHGVWLVAILFAFLHPSENQVLGALFVGVVAGWAVYRTRSIWSGILLHAGTNLVSGLLVLMSSLAGPAAIQETEAAADAGSMIWIGLAVWGGIGLVMLLPVFFLIRSLSRKYPAPTWPGAGLRVGALWSFAIAAIGIVAYTLYSLLRRAG